MRAASALLAIVAWAGVSTAAEIHRCPQPDGTTRFQDRPCGAEPARPTAQAPDAARRADERASRAPAAARTAPASSAPAADPVATVVERSGIDSAAPPRPERGGSAAIPADTRADYVARNAARCRDGDRRACAAVTCERSGRLDSPACQEAVGYLRGPGWDLRPRSDLFDPARASDEFTLTCRGGARRATLSRARGTDAYVWPAAAGADRTATDVAATVGKVVPRAALPEAAREFCAAR